MGTTKPKEGATGWSDTWMVKKDTGNINCSYLWLDHVVSPEVNAQIAEYFGEAPANQKSCELTKNKDHCAEFHAEETDFWSDVWYWTTPAETAWTAGPTCSAWPTTSGCAPGRSCVARDLGEHLTAPSCGRADRSPPSARPQRHGRRRNVLEAP